VSEEATVDPSTVVAALGVSVYEARAARRHNRISVRPLLELRTSFHPGRTAGLQLVNAGLGPAVITGSTLRLKGAQLGPFDEATVNQVRERLETVWPSAVTFGPGSILATDYDRYLLAPTASCGAAQVPPRPGAALPVPVRRRDLDGPLVAHAGRPAALSAAAAPETALKPR
jgi:hypothetical protein